MEPTLYLNRLANRTGNIAAQNSCHPIKVLMNVRLVIFETRSLIIIRYLLKLVLMASNGTGRCYFTIFSSACSDTCECQHQPGCQLRARLCVPAIVLRYLPTTLRQLVLRSE